MDKRTILQRIKSLLASLGWKLFIWGNETTQERYWNEIYLQEWSRQSTESLRKIQDRNIVLKHFDVDPNAGVLNMVKRKTPAEMEAAARKHLSPLERVEYSWLLDLEKANTMDAVSWEKLKNFRHFLKNI